MAFCKINLLISIKLPQNTQGIWAVLSPHYLFNYYFINKFHVDFM